MPTEDKPRPDRTQTDHSLRSERSESDRVLLEKQAEVEEQADRVVDRARDQADAVLDAARDKADDHQRPTRGAVSRAAILVERATEDEVVRTERATADARLKAERAEHARALSKLLPLERAKTDTYLLTERDLSDDEVANRDDFLGMVSHDLRNLLGGIVMSAEVLGDAASADAAGQRLVSETARIQRYAARMNRLIGDLVDVASIDAGRLALLPTAGDAGALLAEAVDLFEGVAAAKGLSLRNESAGAALPVMFDHDRMIQVLANLITNSIKFTARGGLIRVRGESTTDGVRITVTDDGTGIPSSMLEAVFQRFWQVGKNDRRGVGLGLYISKCIMEAHGGDIVAASEAGAGSTFTITLPAAGS